ncbi:MAG: N-(5'-phosphoribosyl)anthranilate isomerase [Flavisolibacter sp.]
MVFSSRPLVKICCIASLKEAEMAIQSGAAAIGLVAKMPSGPGPIPDQLIRSIAQSVPPPIASFLLTSETSVDDIVAHHRRTCTNTIQIVDELKEGSYTSLKKRLPSIKIVQVIHVLDESSIDAAIRISEQVDALLLDSGNPKLTIKQLGGTGRVHNWKLSRSIVNQSKVPVFLAGGLNASNVGEAISQVNPFGIDLCTGVRTEGLLDEEKLSIFFKAVHSS